MDKQVRYLATTPFDPVNERALLRSPGDGLLEIMEICGIDIQNLAFELRIPVEQAQQLLDGKLPLTEEIAIDLERIVRIGRQFWINREAYYRAKLSQIIQAENEQTIKFIEKKTGRI